MKNTDPVMDELYKVKAANAARLGNLITYVAYLTKLGKEPHPGGVVSAAVWSPVQATD